MESSSNCNSGGIHDTTMEDWQDESAVEQETIAMMRHFGMMSMTDRRLSPIPDIEEPLPSMILIENHNLPYILGPSCFEPGRKINNNQLELKPQHSSKLKNWKDIIVNGRRRPLPDQGEVHEKRRKMDDYYHHYY
ncbi:uncharacterized protein LOC117781196 [Drosophila innubila]|uniref:uncharacterized protein LOC117781196 n=1 Tax=Drosophila innubila TaxID=198719 RepID=UPI00148BBE26|nr:uncharacterized protein LOC117781196 [Drosophila innubila]